MGMTPSIVVTVRRAAVLLVLALALHGCAVLPQTLERLWPLGGSDPSELTRADPSAVRMALKLPLPARPEPQGATLVALVSGGDREPVSTRLPMTLVNEGRTVRADALPSADPGYWWYLFKLTSSAERDLESFQSRLSAAGDSGRDRVEFSVDLAYENIGAGRSVSRSVLLKLSERDAFFTVTEGVHTVGEDDAGAGP
jgi:hypothetical protein